MIVVRSVIYFVYCFIINWVFFLTMGWILFAGRRGAMLGTLIWGAHGVWAAKHIVGIKYQVTGEIPTYPVIYASKHESAWETMFLHAAIKRPIFVIKKELLWVPPLNLLMYMAGYIVINRRKGAEALKRIIRGTKDSLARGTSVIIFPEGTRVPHGADADIKPGIVAAYMNNNAQVVPIALNSGKCWARNSFIKQPGVISVHFGKPIEPGLSKKELVERLKQEINIFNNG